MGQVALNWVICKGAIPIPGASSAAQIDDNLGALSQYTRFFSIRTCGYVMYIDSRMYHTLTPTLAVQRAGALGWRLTDSEVRTLEEAADALEFDWATALSAGAWTDFTSSTRTVEEAADALRGWRLD